MTNSNLRKMDVHIKQEIQEATPSPEKPRRPLEDYMDVDEDEFEDEEKNPEKYVSLTDYMRRHDKMDVELVIKPMAMSPRKYAEFLASAADLSNGLDMD